MNQKKKGYLSLEAIIIVAITLVIAIAVYWVHNNNMQEAVDEIGTKIAATDTYMGAQIKEAYTSDYSGVDLDDGWGDGSGAQQGTTIPIYTMVSSIKTPETEYFLEVGEEMNLDVEVYPTNASQSRLSWKVISGKDKTLITRDDTGHSGTILGQKAGKTALRISATDGSGESKTIYVTVTQPVTGLTLDKENQTLSLYFSGVSSTTVQATVLPDTGDSLATERRVSWSFGNAGANSECFEMNPNYSTNTLTISLNGNAVPSYCAGKEALIIAKTEDGGFQKTFRVIAQR